MTGLGLRRKPLPTRVSLSRGPGRDGGEVHAHGFQIGGLYAACDRAWRAVADFAACGVVQHAAGLRLVAARDVAADEAIFRFSGVLIGIYVEGVAMSDNLFIIDYQPLALSPP